MRSKYVYLLALLHVVFLVGLKQPEVRICAGPVVRLLLDDRDQAGEDWAHSVRVQADYDTLQAPDRHIGWTGTLIAGSPSRLRTDCW